MYIISEQKIQTQSLTVMKIELTNALRNEINNEIKKGESVIQKQLDIIDMGFPMQANTDLIISYTKSIESNKKFLKQGFIS